MPPSNNTTTTARTASDFLHEFDAFNGSLTRYRSTFGMLYTEGVKHLIANSHGVVGPSGKQCRGAFWLLDLITFSQSSKVREACDGFQLWTLVVDNAGDGPGATLTCRPDADQEPVITERIEHTDFPLATATLYVIDNIALLPSEY